MQAVQHSIEQMMVDLQRQLEEAKQLSHNLQARNSLLERAMNTLAMTRQQVGIAKKARGYRVCHMQVWVTS